jgi:AcrR family transcriptional regulator
MAPRGKTGNGVAGSPRSAATRKKILDATAEVIRTRGFVGATTAAIAEEAGVNEGVIFYHFGSMSGVYGATLERAVGERLTAYDEGLADADGLSPLLETAGRLFAEDEASGYMTVLAQLIAGSSAVQDLKPQLVGHVEQWIDLVRRHVTSGVAAGPLGPLLPPERDLALLVVSVFMGAELLNDLAPELGATEALSALTRQLAALDISGGQAT